MSDPRVDVEEKVALDNLVEQFQAAEKVVSAARYVQLRYADSPYERGPFWEAIDGLFSALAAYPDKERNTGSEPK